jgi:molecular chaperone GrpE
MNDEKKIPGEAATPKPADRPATDGTPANGGAQASAPSGESAAQPPISEAQLREMIKALQVELDKKSAELSAKHDQLLRTAAETENVRRRLEKEKEETAKYAISKFAKDIISVGDNFQRAIDAVPKDAIETDPALRSLLDGVVLAERDYQMALERHGVKGIDPSGQPFNPHHHQAVMEQDNPDVPAGTVLQVFQIGYLIDDRCLRPAMVVVSRGGTKAAKADPNAGEPPAAPASTSDVDAAAHEARSEPSDDEGPAGS